MTRSESSWQIEVREAVACFSMCSRELEMLSGTYVIRWEAAGALVRMADLRRR